MNASSQARKQIMTIPLKALTSVKNRSRMSRTKTTDPVTKKIVPKRRRLLAGRRLIERRPASRSFGTAVGTFVVAVSGDGVGIEINPPLPWPLGVGECMISPDLRPWRALFWNPDRLPP
jgi:hypothetical protein